MKALTIIQPWASLIAWGEKEYETRSWHTHYRGLLAIHASKKPCMDPEACILNSFYRQALHRRGVTVDMLPLGKVLCIVELVDVFKTEDLTFLSQKEEHFGDFSSGRYAWKMIVREAFKEPIHAVGHQGLWEWDKERAK